MVHSRGTSDDGPIPALRDRLPSASHVLCCVDFDGTLAPIETDPAAVEMTPGNRNALSQLHRSSAVTVAIVSGRSIADLRRLVDLPVVLAGNHGFELARGGSRAVHPIARRKAHKVEIVRLHLETILGGVPNLRFENKNLTATIHLRTVPATLRPMVESVTHEVVAGVAPESVAVTSGKAVLELRPALAWGKGQLVQLLAREQPPETCTVVLGDDQTDEDAFKAVESTDITVLVGPNRPTHARYRVASPAAVESVLNWLKTEGTGLLATDSQAESRVSQ